MAPPSQRYRRIGFLLQGGTGGYVRFDFAIRPEDLTVTEPSRMQVMQTLGGAWADAFDRGVASINLAGHNGWRGGVFVSGEDLFLALRDTVFVEWHNRRRQAAEQGTDPDQVKLFFIDTLDSINALVAPKQFVLRRSKASPLLMKYQITLLVLDDGGGSLGLLDSIVSAISNPLRWVSAQTGLGNILVTLDSTVRGAANAVGSIGAAIRRFGTLGASAIQAVRSVAEDSRGVFEGEGAAVRAAGLAVTRAGQNAFSALAADQLLTSTNRAALMAAAAQFGDARCTIANGYQVGTTFPAFDGLFGASNCSSTGGGRPWSPYAVTGTSPLPALFPAGTGRVSITSGGRAALTELGGDPLDMVGDTARIGRLLAEAADGTAIA